MNQPTYSDLTTKILKGFSEGVANAIAERKRKNKWIAVWKDGKVVKIPAHLIEIPEENEPLN